MSIIITAIILCFLLTLAGIILTLRVIYTVSSELAQAKRDFDAENLRRAAAFPKDYADFISKR